MNANPDGSLANSDPLYHEVSEIVGRQRCGHFGGWDVSSSHARIIGVGPSVPETRNMTAPPHMRLDRRFEQLYTR